MWFELHKHSHYSVFDGFGKISEIVDYAVELGMPAMGISDHGNTCGVFRLYKECLKAEIKPIMGCEVYFQPVFNKDKPSYHLCLFAKDQIGYSNLMKIVTLANENNFYRTGKVDFELLEKYHEGLICTTACVGGFIPQAIIANNKKVAYKAIEKFKSIFGDDLYFEIMPQPVDNEGTQEKVNQIMFKLSKDYGIKCIPTTDSHFTRESDFDSYKIMHEMAKHNYDIEQTYRGRHMHSQTEIYQKLLKQFSSNEIKTMFGAMDEIYNKINVVLDFTDSIPEFESENSYEELKSMCLVALKALNFSKKKNKKYIERIKQEIKVIDSHGICDYFLIVADYVREAKDRDIYVGPGRGSVCGSLIANLLGITAIDPIIIGNDFERFLRADKKKMPDIDIDFENGRRDELIEYLLEKYKGSSAQVLTFGFWKVNNTMNDLAKYYEMDLSDLTEAKQILNKLIDEKAHFNFENVDLKQLLSNSTLREFESHYKNKGSQEGVITTFSKLFGQIKYLGTHAAGVVITKGPIMNWVSLVKYKGKFATCFDKYDIEEADMLKFDMLALKTLNVLHDIEIESNYKYNTYQVSEIKKAKMYEEFGQGNTAGIFQLNKKTAQDILVSIRASDIQDLIAGISLNRPGTLKLGTHEQYGDNKTNPPTSNLWYQYTKDSYGTIVYQEHVLRICRGIAHMDPNDIDKLMKFKFSEEDLIVLREKFLKGCLKNHPKEISRREAEELFDSMTLYLFNKGHASGYAFISEWQMYHKIYNPVEFWYATLKHVYEVSKEWQYKAAAVKSGIVLVLPHVNYSANYSIGLMDGEKVIHEGLLTIKGLGLKAAELIEQERIKNGPFTSLEDFTTRCKNRSVHKGIIEKLINTGALEFNKKKFFNRVVKYNSTYLLR